MPTTFLSPLRVADLGASPTPGAMLAVLHGPGLENGADQWHARGGHLVVMARTWLRQGDPADGTPGLGGQAVETLLATYGVPAASEEAWQLFRACAGLSDTRAMDTLLHTPWPDTHLGALQRENQAACQVDDGARYAALQRLVRQQGWLEDPMAYALGQWSKAPGPHCRAVLLTGLPLPQPQDVAALVRAWKGPLFPASADRRRAIAGCARALLDQPDHRHWPRAVRQRLERQAWLHGPEGRDGKAMRRRVRQFWAHGLTVRQALGDDPARLLLSTPLTWRERGRRAAVLLAALASDRHETPARQRWQQRRLWWVQALAMACPGSSAVALAPLAQRLERLARRAQALGPAASFLTAVRRWPGGLSSEMTRGLLELQALSTVHPLPLDVSLLQPVLLQALTQTLADLSSPKPALVLARGRDVVKEATQLPVEYSAARMTLLAWARRAVPLLDAPLAVQERLAHTLEQSLLDGARHGVFASTRAWAHGQPELEALDRTLEALRLNHCLPAEPSTARSPRL